MARSSPRRRPTYARGPARSRRSTGDGPGSSVTSAVPRRRLQLLVALNGSLAVAAWIGGDLVYRLGWRVRPAEELEQLDAGRSRDEALAAIEAHEREDTLLS